MNNEKIICNVRTFPAFSMLLLLFFYLSHHLQVQQTFFMFQISLFLEWEIKTHTQKTFLLEEILSKCKVKLNHVYLHYITISNMIATNIKHKRIQKTTTTEKNKEIKKNEKKNSTSLWICAFSFESLFKPNKDFISFLVQFLFFFLLWKDFKWQNKK